MTGGVHNVDLGTVIMYGGILGQDGNAAFTLNVVGVHDAIHHLLILAVHAALLQHLIHQRGLAVVNVGDNSNISNIITNHRYFKPRFYVKRRNHLQSIRRFRQLQALVILAGQTDAPFIFKQQHVSSAAVLRTAGGGGQLQVLHVLGGLDHPADVMEGHTLHDDLRLILRFQPVLQHFKLKHADHADHEFLAARLGADEGLDRALLRQLGNTLLELLALHAVHGANAVEEFGGKHGDVLIMQLGT